MHVSGTRSSSNRLTWPRRLHPQVYTVPCSDTAAVCSSPATICLIRSGLLGPREIAAQRRQRAHAQCHHCIAGMHTQTQSSAVGGKDATTDSTHHQTSLLAAEPAKVTRTHGQARTWRQKRSTRAHHSTSTYVDDPGLALAGKDSVSALPTASTATQPLKRHRGAIQALRTGVPVTPSPRVHVPSLAEDDTVSRAARHRNRARAATPQLVLQLRKVLRPAAWEHVAVV